MDAHQLENRIGRSIILSISGMTCGGCARSVELILSKVPGVERVEVGLAHGHAVVEGAAHPEALVDALADAGWSAKSVYPGGSCCELSEGSR
jgi:copper chaperone CopZ